MITEMPAADFSSEEASDHFLELLHKTLQASEVNTGTVSTASVIAAVKTPSRISLRGK